MRGECRGWIIIKRETFLYSSVVAVVVTAAAAFDCVNSECAKSGCTYSDSHSQRTELHRLMLNSIIRCVEPGLTVLSAL